MNSATSDNVPAIRKLNLAYYPSLEKYFSCCRHLAFPIALSSDLTANDNKIFDAKNGSRKLDILAANPIFVINDAQACWHDTAAELEKQCDIYLSRDLEKIENVPFVGAAVGFASYSGATRANGISPIDEFTNSGAAHRSASDTRSAPATEVPPIFVGVYQWIIALDHHNKQCTLLADPKFAENSWDDLCSIFQYVDEHAKQQQSDFSLLSDWRCTTTKALYESQFQKVKEYIHAGDTYQINLSREFTASYSGDEWRAFQKLRGTIPAPFSGFVNTPSYSVASFSPERFIQIKDGLIKTQPIKGTRARKSLPSADRRAVQDLLNSEKDRAENLMIVDLMRNDIGKHCKTGSVKVPSLFEVQSFSNVHHLVSTITGELQEQSVRSSINCLLDCLPGGSITGAPKIRAMQIINELETHDRSVYCGSLFYVTADGNLDSNILIRSLLFTHPNEADSDKEANRVHCWGGGGLVADSQLETEYDESYYKVSHLLDALASVQ